LKRIIAQDKCYMLKFRLALEIKLLCIAIFTVVGLSVSSLFTKQAERVRSAELACHPKRGE